MHKWETQRQVYVDENRLEDMSVESRVARRVMRGMGITHADKNIYAVEQQVMGTVYSEQPLWQRVERLWLGLLRRNSDHCQRPESWTLDVVEVRNEKAALKRFEFMIEEGVENPLLFVMFSETNTDRAYSKWDPADAAKWLDPPARIEKEIGSWPHWLVTQDIETFVKQFGVYYME